MTSELRKFLYDNLYHHDEVAQVNTDAAAKIRDLFEVYCKAPRKMGSFANSRIEKDGLRRAVADYIAGMTDRFAILEHKKFCG